MQATGRLQAHASSLSTFGTRTCDSAAVLPAQLVLVMWRGFVCAGGIMSYALDSQASDSLQQDEDYNHFVVFDAYDLIACHDFQASSNATMLIKQKAVVALP